MRAVTEPLPVAVDLNDVARGDGVLFVRDGVGFAGRGTAARVDLDGAAALLASIDHDDRVGGTPGPVAIGAVPFRPGSPAELVVPAVLVGKDGSGRAWVTRIDGAEAELTAPAPTPSTATFTLRPAVPEEHYLRAVEHARDAVRAGRLAKAVIARPVRVESDRPIDVHAVLRRLKASFG
nr:hypothetical protein [Ilumatobacteraceae bacterium]